MTTKILLTTILLAFSSASFATTKCDHRFVSGGNSLLQNTNPKSTTSKPVVKTVKADSNKGVR